jgi:hypothetical protein
MKINKSLEREKKQNKLRFYGGESGRSVFVIQGIMIQRAEDIKAEKKAKKSKAKRKNKK